MKKGFMMLAIAVAISAASVAQTKPAPKKAEAKKECCKKEGHSCCSPSSKAKALSTAKPAGKKG